jgi:hypothetical protein
MTKSDEELVRENKLLQSQLAHAQWELKKAEKEVTRLGSMNEEGAVGPRLRALNKELRTQLEEASTRAHSAEERCGVLETRLKASQEEANAAIEQATTRAILAQADAVDGPSMQALRKIEGLEVCCCVRVS